MVFYQVFLLSPLQCTVTYSRNCKRLREFEEIEISSCRGDCELMQEYFGHLDHLRILGLVPLLWPPQGQAPQIQGPQFLIITYFFCYNFSRLLGFAVSKMYW